MIPGNVMEFSWEKKAITEFRSHLVSSPDPHTGRNLTPNFNPRRGSPDVPDKRNKLSHLLENPTQGQELLEVINDN